MPIDIDDIKNDIRSSSLGGISPGTIATRKRREATLPEDAEGEWFSACYEPFACPIVKMLFREV